MIIFRRVQAHSLIFGYGVYGMSSASVSPHVPVDRTLNTGGQIDLCPACRGGGQKYQFCIFLVIYRNIINTRFISAKTAANNKNCISNHDK